MKKRILLPAVSFAAALVAAPLVADTLPEPPVAPVKPHKLENNGHERIDNYYWLNERDAPDVLKYLNAENEYCDAVMAHTKGLQEQLFEEIKGRIQQDDASVPYKFGHYYYYDRTEEGRSYTIYCRKKGSLEAREEIMLDVNDLAEGHEHMRVRGLEVSPSEKLLSYATDDRGRRIYTIHIKNLETGNLLEDEIPGVSGGVAWANDNKTIFYEKKDPVTLRDYQVWRHVLGAPVSEDVLVYEENDDEYSIGVWRTRSQKYIFIGSFQSIATEYRYLDVNDPTGEFKVIAPRERDHEYYVDHYKDKFYILSNDHAKNFKLMTVSVKNPSRENWEELIPARDDVLLSTMEMFDKYLVLVERKDALLQIRIRPWSGKEEHYLDFGEQAYDAYLGDNPDPKTTMLRFEYSSMTTPQSTFDYDMDTHEKKLLKQDKVLGGFDSNNYYSERLYATSRDGKRVPISIVYRKGIKKDGSNPTVLYGYGSYGYSMDAYFSASRISLLDRGFIWAIAHVRGGQEYGREWYDDGKMFHKKNTFNDFVDCAEYLVDQGYTNPDKLFAWGGSAGGLLVGAVTNMRPDLFKGVIADVPFVDVVTTMLDESIPLTSGEYDEWGNPHNEDSYQYMMSYSPYDNIHAAPYPNILAMTGYHDSQVQYFEPAKWVAKLRAITTGNNRILLKTDMDAGHSGGSGRFKQYHETAFQYSFLLDLIGAVPKRAD